MKTQNKQITRSDERLRTKIEWLDSRHSFSFGGHYDPERMGFGPLRVVNDDRVAPGGGFSPHRHANMEIVSLVLEGSLEHKDSMGNGRVINAGDIQYMSAGSGVVHSEFNPSAEDPVHFLQIWIEPEAKGLEPRYADQPILGGVDDAWNLILSGDGRGDSIQIRQDVDLWSARLTSGASIDHSPSRGRGLWIFVIEGTVAVADEQLSAGDSLALAGVGSLEFRNEGDVAAKVLLFDLRLD